MHVLISLLLLSAPFEVETTAGVGGIVWEQPANLLPAMESSSMIAWSWRIPLKSSWLLGSTLGINAYQGRYPDYTGPLFGVVDVMAYHRRNMNNWQLNLGAGIAFGMLHARRIVSEPSADVPAGRYDLLVPSLYAAFHGEFLRRMHPRVYVGVSLRYYSGRNTGPCWDGPVADCRDVDRDTQHWLFGGSIVVLFP